MTHLTLENFLSCIRLYLEGKAEFSKLRDFIFQYYEAEADISLDQSLDQIFPVLAPYFEFEESMGDPTRRYRMLRLEEALKADSEILERAVFALEFDRIQELKKKLLEKHITRSQYEDQLRKVSPVKFDMHRVKLWSEGIRSQK